jgi:hypothetical protein
MLECVNIDRFTDVTESTPNLSYNNVGTLGESVGGSLRIMQGVRMTSTSEIEAMAQDGNGRLWVQTQNSFYRIVSVPGKATEQYAAVEKHQKELDEPAQKTAWNLWGLLGKKQ